MSSTPKWLPGMMLEPSLLLHHIIAPPNIPIFKCHVYTVQQPQHHQIKVPWQQFIFTLIYMTKKVRIQHKNLNLAEKRLFPQHHRQHVEWQLCFVVIPLPLNMRFCVINKYTSTINWKNPWLLQVKNKILSYWSLQ